jgi:LuxR family maltose regulon positive regulatory protein
LLARLYRANLFLIPLDDEEHWYRYHRLFADLLQELQKSQIPEQIAMLHQRASHWYEEQGMVNEAIQHALAGADYPTTVRIIEGNALSMLMEWHIKTVEGWMAAVPIEFCAESPLANLAFAWIHLLRGHPEHAFPYLERLQNMFSDPQFEGHADKTLKAKWFAMQCMLLNAQGKTSESINLGQEALKIAPTSDLHLHSMIHLGLAGAYQLMDDYQKATNAFKMILRNGQMANNIVTELLGLSGIALLAIQHGQLKLAFELATQAIERMENAGILPPISTGLFGELGTIYYQWYQLDQAHAYFQRAIQVSILSGYSDAELFYGVILSQLCLIENNIEGAAEAIQKSAALMQVEAPAAVREEVLSQQIRVYLAQDRLNSAEIVLTEFPKIIAGETFSFQGEFIYPPLENSQALPLTTQESLSKTLGKMYHCALRILLYRAVKKNEISNLKAGLDLANQLIDKALLHQYIPYALDTLLLRARIYAALGNNQAYLDDVRQALEMAAPEGIISVFVEEGEIIIKALAQINDQQLSGSIEPAYIKRILKASESSGKSGKSADKVIRESDLLIEPLSEREIDVLRLIAKGDTYNEIANQLYISVNTVRSHVKAIYDKMNVNNRTRAIEQASRMHIL